MGSSCSCPVHAPLLPREFPAWPPCQKLLSSTNLHRPDPRCSNPTLLSFDIPHVMTYPCPQCLLPTARPWHRQH